MAISDLSSHYQDDFPAQVAMATGARHPAARSLDGVLQLINIKINTLPQECRKQRTQRD